MIPLNNHTHYSLLSAYCKPDKLADIAKELEYPALAITDLDSLSGSIALMSSLEKAGIKPIIGTKLRLNPYGGYITLLAKNLDGWKELVATYLYTNINDDRSINLAHIERLQNCICITGDVESSLYTEIIAKKSVYSVQNPSQSLSFYLQDNHGEKIEQQLTTLKSIFGDDLYVGLQKCTNIAIDKVCVGLFSNAAKKLGITTVALNNTYCHKDEELEELRILLCIREKTKLANMNEYVHSEEHGELFRFFNDTQFSLYDKKYYEDRYTSEEIAATHEIANKIEAFTLLKKPQTPNFECPNGMSQKEYLLELCRKGWTRVKSKLDPKRTQEYVDRVKYELDVINRVGLEGYFLITQDYVNWARERMLVGIGRGSVNGSLISYLLNISGIDPLQYNLMFERFYSEGRLTFPDIDVDFPVRGREDVIAYIRDKYGSENVGQVFTLFEMQGRSAIREVLRVCGACLPEYINIISKKLPQRASISDKLEEQKEKSIIRWTLNNDPELLEDWCKLDEEGNLIGEYAKYFDIAIRMEGTFKGYGKHASAVVISDRPLAHNCPMIKDKSSDELLLAIEFELSEEMGYLKADVLGLNTLDKLECVNQLLEFGEIKNNQIILEEEDE